MRRFGKKETLFHIKKKLDLKKTFSLAGRNITPGQAFIILTRLNVLGSLACHLRLLENKEYLLESDKRHTVKR